MINLIPYNSTSVAANYRAPSREHCLFFQSVLQNSYGLFTTTRVEMGADIEGACGQLALDNQNLVLKPRGLADDTALPSEDMLPSAASASSCASPGSPPLDIEDFLAPGGGASGGAGKPRGLVDIALPCLDIAGTGLGSTRFFLRRHFFSLWAQQPAPSIRLVQPYRMRADGHPRFPTASPPPERTDADSSPDRSEENSQSCHLTFRWQHV